MVALRELQEQYYDRGLDENLSRLLFPNVMDFSHKKSQIRLKQKNIEVYGAIIDGVPHPWFEIQFTNKQVADEFIRHLSLQFKKDFGFKSYTKDNNFFAKISKISEGDGLKNFTQFCNALSAYQDAPATRQASSASRMSTELDEFSRLPPPHNELFNRPPSEEFSDPSTLPAPPDDDEIEASSVARPSINETQTLDVGKPLWRYEELSLTPGQNKAVTTTIFALFGINARNQSTMIKDNQDLLEYSAIFCQQIDGATPAQSNSGKNRSFFIFKITGPRFKDIRYSLPNGSSSSTPREKMPDFIVDFTRQLTEHGIPYQAVSKVLKSFTGSPYCEIIFSSEGFSAFKHFLNTQAKSSTNGISSDMQREVDSFYEAFMPSRNPSSIKKTQMADFHSGNVNYHFSSISSSQMNSPGLEHNLTSASLSGSQTDLNTDEPYDTRSQHSDVEDSYLLGTFNVGSLFVVKVGQSVVLEDSLLSEVNHKLAITLTQNPGVLELSTRMLIQTGHDGSSMDGGARNFFILKIKNNSTLSTFQYRYARSQERLDGVGLISYINHFINALIKKGIVFHALSAQQTEGFNKTFYEIVFDRAQFIAFQEYFGKSDGVKPNIPTPGSIGLTDYSARSFVSFETCFLSVLKYELIKAPTDSDIEKMCKEIAFTLKSLHLDVWKFELSAPTIPATNLAKLAYIQTKAREIFSQEGWPPSHIGNQDSIGQARTQLLLTFGQPGAFEDENKSYKQQAFLYFAATLLGDDSIPAVRYYVDKLERDFRSKEEASFTYGELNAYDNGNSLLPPNFEAVLGDILLNPLYDETKDGTLLKLVNNAPFYNADSPNGMVNIGNDRWGKLKQIRLEKFDFFNPVYLGLLGRPTYLSEVLFPQESSFISQHPYRNISISRPKDNELFRQDIKLVAFGEKISEALGYFAQGETLLFSRLATSSEDCKGYLESLGDKILSYLQDPSCFILIEVVQPLIMVSHVLESVLDHLYRSGKLSSTINLQQCREHIIIVTDPFWHLRARQQDSPLNVWKLAGYAALRLAQSAYPTNFQQRKTYLEKNIRLLFPEEQECFEFYVPQGIYFTELENEQVSPHNIITGLEVVKSKKNVSSLHSPAAFRRVGYAQYAVAASALSSTSQAASAMPSSMGYSPQINISPSSTSQKKEFIVYKTIPSFKLVSLLFQNHLSIKIEEVLRAEDNLEYYLGKSLDNTQILLTIMKKATTQFAVGTCKNFNAFIQQLLLPQLGSLGIYYAYAQAPTRDKGSWAKESFNIAFDDSDAQFELFLNVLSRLSMGKYEHEALEADSLKHDRPPSTTSSRDSEDNAMSELSPTKPSKKLQQFEHRQKEYAAMKSTMSPFFANKDSFIRSGHFIGNIRTEPLMPYSEQPSSLLIFFENLLQAVNEKLNKDLRGRVVKFNVDDKSAVMNNTLSLQFIPVQGSASQDECSTDNISFSKNGSMFYFKIKSSKQMEQELLSLFEQANMRDNIRIMLAYFLTKGGLTFNRNTDLPSTFYYQTEQVTEPFASSAEPASSPVEPSSQTTEASNSNTWGSRFWSSLPTLRAPLAANASSLRPYVEGESSIFNQPIQERFGMLGEYHQDKSHNYQSYVLDEENGNTPRNMKDIFIFLMEVRRLGSVLVKSLLSAQLTLPTLSHLAYLGSPVSFKECRDERFDILNFQNSVVDNLVCLDFDRTLSAGHCGDTFKKSEHKIFSDQNNGAFIRKGAIDFIKKTLANPRNIIAIVSSNPDPWAIYSLLMREISDEFALDRIIICTALVSFNAQGHLLKQDKLLQIVYVLNYLRIKNIQVIQNVWLFDDDRANVRRVTEWLNFSKGKGVSHLNPLFKSRLFLDIQKINAIQVERAEKGKIPPSDAELFNLTQVFSRAVNVKLIKTPKEPQAPPNFNARHQRSEREDRGDMRDN